jgi:dTDP-4-amino-4,6-dideoxygalactose transaminase
LCEEHGLLLIEDCAQSITARCADGRLTGTIGAAGCFSFFSKEQLPVGEGGMVITADEMLAAKVRSLRSHAMTSVTWDRHRGHAESYDIVDIGFNFRIDEPRAALGLKRLERVEHDVAQRRALVKLYREQLAEVAGLTIPWSDADVELAAHFGFTIVLDSGARRDQVRRELEARGVQTTWYPAITKLSAYADHPPRPLTEDLGSRHLLLPLASTFTADHVEQVVMELTGLLRAAA